MARDVVPVRAIYAGWAGRAKPPGNSSHLFCVRTTINPFHGAVSRHMATAPYRPPVGYAGKQIEGKELKDVYY